MLALIEFDPVRLCESVNQLKSDVVARATIFAARVSKPYDEPFGAVEWLAVTTKHAISVSPPMNTVT